MNLRMKVIWSRKRARRPASRVPVLEDRHGSPAAAAYRRAMMTPDQEIQLKEIAARLVASMLDNHNGDWDEQQTAKAFRTMYDAVKNTN